MQLHPDLTWRAVTPADAPALLRLFNAVEEADAQPYRMALPEVEDMLAEPWRDLARDTVLGVDATGTPRAYMTLVAPPGDTSEKRVFLDGGVEQEWRGRGVGRTLIAWALARSAEMLAGTSADVPWRVGVICGTEDERSQRLFTRAGLAPLRWYASLKRDLADPLPDVLVPDGIRLAEWTPGDDEEVRQAHNAAFADHWGSQPMSAEDWASGRTMFAPGWSLVARDTTQPGEPVVGYLLSDRFEEDWPAQGFTSGYLSRLGVLRSQRGRGLATALLAEALHRIAADGLEAATLGVDTANPTGAFRLYESLGFVEYHGEVLYAVTSTGGARLDDLATL